MSTSVTPATNTETVTPSTTIPPPVPITTPIPITTPVSTPLAPVQITTSETPIAQALSTVHTVATTTDIKKGNLNNLEKNTVHIVVQGIFVFIIGLLVIGLIGYFLFSHEEEAFRFRELFYPHKELVPKI